MSIRIRHFTAISSLCLALPLALSGQEVSPPTNTALNPATSPVPQLLIPTSSPAIPDGTPSVVQPPNIDTALAAPASASPALAAPVNELPATIEPPIGAAASDPDPNADPTANAGVAVPGPDATAPSAAGDADAGGVRPREFQGDELGTVLRLLARQAKIDLVVGETITGTVTMRLTNKTALQAIQIIVLDKGLYMYDTDGTYFIKTMAEKAKEQTEPAFYTMSYARADAVAPLLNSQLVSGIPAQFDPRTNTIYYREAKSNLAVITSFLLNIDRPTRQVMIEARLVEVNANPKQSYGVNWAGSLGSSTNAQTFRYGGVLPGTVKYNDTGTALIGDQPPTVNISAGGQFQPADILEAAGLGSSKFNSLGNQFAILSIPSFSATLRLLNEDQDAEFLANPRVVTADNQEATIKIIRSQPVPQLNFNEQTATAVFGGFENKEYGNKLVVKPAINKDDFISLSVKPEISNKVSDATFTFNGATVSSPVIDTRTIESNVLIKSGDTLAIGGLLQDETGKQRNKVPVLGDIPVVGYLFQEKLNARNKRNLLVFVTPTIIQQGYGTGLEDQVSGLAQTGEEFADPSGWRNNAKGSLRVLPTSNRQLAADYAKPGVAPAPRKIQMKSNVYLRK